MNGIYNSYYFWWKLRMNMRRRISRHFVVVESECLKGFNIDTLFEIKKVQCNAKSQHCLYRPRAQKVKDMMNDETYEHINSCLKVS